MAMNRPSARSAPSFQCVSIPSPSAPQKIVLTEIPFVIAFQHESRKFTVPWVNGSFPAMKMTLSTSSDALQSSPFAASAITCPQYSSPPFVFSANSSSDSRSRSVVNGSTRRMNPPWAGSPLFPYSYSAT
jgi:hypothetical protein